MATAIRTAEQLLESSHMGRTELVRGELAVMLPAGGRHGQLAMRIGHVLAEFVDRHELGEVLAAETGFVLARDPDTVRAPDVAFVRRGREIGDGFIEGAPDLAVEVLSPSDRPGYVREKVAEWLEAGAGAVWVVDPIEQTAQVHTPNCEPTALASADTLTGGELLPGFELPLAQVFR